MNGLQLPQEILDKYTLVESFYGGGSVAKTFLVRDQNQKLYILKYADWDGIGYNGTPWVETQTKRMVEFKKLLPNSGGQYFPAVYEHQRIKNVFYAILEYLEDATTLSEYYLSYDDDLIDPYLADIDKVISLWCTYFYPQGTVETPRNYIKEIHINRVNYRLSLFSQKDSETYKRYIENNDFVLGNFRDESMSSFFKSLLSKDQITINGSEYVNAPLILAAIENNPVILDYLTPTFLPKYTHGDSLLRNYLKLPDGSIKIIDLRGTDLPHDTPSEVCIPYDLGKMLHSIEMDIVRSNNFDLSVSLSDSFDFQFHYHTENKNIASLLEVSSKMPELFKQNKELGKFLSNDPEWLEQSFFAEACHFLSDAVNRLEQDHSGRHSLAYYLIGTILLNRFQKAHNILETA